MPIVSVAIAKLMLVQLPVRRELFPLKVAVNGECVSEVVAIDSTSPVTVDTEESEPMPTFMDILELVMVDDIVDTDIDPCGPRMIELVSPRGEQPTKEGAVSLTVAHSWILNSIASIKVVRSAVV